MKYSNYFDYNTDIDAILRCTQRHYPTITMNNYIAHGLGGVCFNLNETQVVKVTKCISEAVTSIKVMDNPVSVMPRFFEVAIDGDYAVILMQRCDELTTTEYNLVENFLDNLSELVEDSILSDSENIKILLSEWSEIASLPVIEELVELIFEAGSVLGIRNLDLTAENVMKIDGSLVLIDQHETNIDKARITYEESFISQYKNSQRQNAA